MSAAETTVTGGNLWFCTQHVCNTTLREATVYHECTDNLTYNFS